MASQVFSSLALLGILANLAFLYHHFTLASLTLRRAVTPKSFAALPPNAPYFTPPDPQSSTTLQRPLSTSQLPLSTIQPPPDSSEEIEAVLLANSSNSVRHFIYHALHKTASAATRHQLARFCREHRLRCLTYQSCAANFVQCAQGLSKATGTELHVNRGSLTPYRIKQGCCPRLMAREAKLGKFTFDAIVEHMPLDIAGNQKYIAERLHADAFHFTILRDPLEQFISYFRYMRAQSHYFGSSLRRFDVSSFVENYSNGTGLRDDLVFRMLSNSQSKELGWDGTEVGLVRVEKFLRGLAFVGIFEEMEETWERLRGHLNWDESYFNYTSQEPRATQVLQSLSTSTLAALRAIQAPDIRLYHTASQLFRQQSREPVAKP